MGVIKLDGLPLQQPEAEPWPIDEHTIRIDEMFARQLDNEFSAGVRGLLHDPETGIAAKSGEAALEAIAGALPALDELKERTLAQAIGPRQRSILEPMIEARLDWAAGTLGQLAQRATVEVDDASVADRIAGLKQDAAMSWQDPAHLRKLGRTAVEELRYQGERRGWEPAEIDAKARSGLSDLYAGAVETAIGRDDLDGASALYDHAREVIDPERQAAIDRRFIRAREVTLYRDVDRDMAGIPIEPEGPPGAEVFAERAAELTPGDASDKVRARIGQVAAFAQHRAERQWNKQQAEAGLVALDWLVENPEASIVALPPEVRDWLAPDQWRGLEALQAEGRVRTDGDLFERLDWQMVYEPNRFAALDLDRHRLSLDDEDLARFADAQKAIAEGRITPDLARHDRLRRGVYRALTTLGIDTDGPAAAKVRTEARGRLKDFEVIEGRPPVGADLDEIARRVVDAVPEAATPRSGESVPVETPLQQGPEVKDVFGPSAEPRVLHNDDGSAEVTAGKIPTPGGPAEATVRIDRDRLGASVEMALPNGHRVESRRTSLDGRTWSQTDTIHDPQGAVVGTQTTTFDSTRFTQTWAPADGPAQTASWQAKPPSGDIHLANTDVAALGRLGTARSLVADSLGATAKAIAGDMLALGTRALGLAGAAAAGVAAGVVTGAAVLLTPTNTQGATVDLGDGVRLRQPPGDSGGVIEKSVLGGNMWDRTPVAVRIRDGVTSDRPRMLTIDATALEREIGPEAAERVLAEAATHFDVVPIYTSRPPAEKVRREDTGGPLLNDPTAASPRTPPPEGPDLKELEPIAHWLIERRFRADKDLYTGADGIHTATGVRLDPRVGEPAAGWDYLPDNESHRKGLRGEYGLANDIARQFTDHTIIEFGRKAGERGPDVISVNRDGEIHFFDSKWRGSDTSISPGGRAHQMERSLQDALKHTESSINAAMNSGRLPPEAAARALENLENRTVTIVTVGTGNARNGVVERIVGGERAVVHPQRRP